MVEERCAQRTEGVVSFVGIVQASRCLGDFGSSLGGSIAAGLLTFWSHLRRHDDESRGGEVMSGMSKRIDE